MEVRLARLRAGEIGDGHLERIDDRHHARHTRFEVFADRAFHDRHIHAVLALRDADAPGEFADAFRRVASAAHTADGRHARIVPAAHMFFVHQLQELALAGDRVVQLQPREFILARMTGDGDVIQHPVVQRAVILELQRADRMGDAFQRVGDAMCVIVHRIDAPPVAGADVVRAADAVDRRVAQVDVGRGHVDPGAQHAAAVGEFAVSHACEQVEVFRHAAITIWAVLAGLGQRAAIFAHLLRRQVVHIGQAFIDQLDRELVQLLEVVRCPAHLAVPLETQPAHVLLDRQRVFLAFLFRVGVVETQVAFSLVILRQSEVQADGFGMADMQIAVRLRRKARDDAAVLAACQIGIDDIADEI